MSKQVGWNNVISAVATEEGLLITERSVNGQVGAPPYLVARGQALLPHSGYRKPSPEFVANPTMYRQWRCSRWAANPMYTGGPVQPMQASYFEWTCQLQNTWQGSQGVVISGYSLASESEPYYQQVCDRIEKRVGIPGNYTWETVLSTCP